MRSEFYIMSAGSLTGNKALTPEQAHQTWAGSASTILVCRRERGYDAESKVFVHGSGAGGYGEPRRSTYTQDTGMGYTNQGKSLIIENVITFDDAGVMTAANNIGMNEKRRLWVMK